MRWSLGVSFSIHAAILLSAIVVLPSPDHFKPQEEESIPVEIVELEPDSKRQAVKEDAPEPEPEQKVAPPKIETEREIKKIAPEPAKEIKQAAREPAPMPEPEPEPEAPKEQTLDELIEEVEPEVAEPTPEPQPEPETAISPEAVPKPMARPKPVKRVAAARRKKREVKFNAEDVAALLNKIDDERKAPPPTSDFAGVPRPSDVTSLIGADDRISADELDWLRQRIGQCWRVPTGVREAQNLVVKVRIQMDPAGNVIGQPVVMNTASHPAFAAAAQSALAAILGCQPYDLLPKEKYDSWRDIILNFDPSKMLALN